MAVVHSNPLHLLSKLFSFKKVTLSLKRIKPYFFKKKELLEGQLANALGNENCCDLFGKLYTLNTLLVIKYHLHLYCK